MKCCICGKVLDLHNSGTKIFTLEERETVYGEHSIYQQQVDVCVCCSTNCMSIIIAKRHAFEDFMMSKMNK